MAYDKDVAQRVRGAVTGRQGLSEREMFGGLCLMVNGNMFAGVMGDELMLRVGPKHFEEMLARPGARPMDFTGRPMNGFVYISPPGFMLDKDLTSWLDAALGFVEGLPAKQPGAGRKQGKHAR